MIKEISSQRISECVARLFINANRSLPADVRACIEAAAKAEPWERARNILNCTVENYRIAEESGVPICQDTGAACVFLEIGQDVHITGKPLSQAVDEGVRKACIEGYLRSSMVSDPIKRTNTGDNTPAILHTDIVPGNAVRVTVAPKGFGSENMSRLIMLKPSHGAQGIEDFVTETAELALGNPCPPTVIGVGIGGTFETCALLAKKALLRPLDTYSDDEYYADMEKRLYTRINGLGIGPQGFGGKTSTLKVNILTMPTHIAGLPVAVNMSCHVTRRAVEVLT